MRRFLQGTLLAITIPVVATAVLALAFPGATGTEGTPDPLLGLRRPVVRWLRGAGVLAKPGFLADDPWLPSGYASESDGWSTAIRKDPVYRGLVWRIGWRVTVEHDTAPTVRTVRIACQVGDRSVAGPDGVRVDGAATPTRVRWRAAAYLPDGWTSWAVQEVEPDGTVRDGVGEERPPPAVPPAGR